MPLQSLFIRTSKMTNHFKKTQKRTITELDDLDRIRLALRKGSIDRNAKTALAVGCAVSGAIVSLPAFVATSAVTISFLYYQKSKVNSN